MFQAWLLTASAPNQACAHQTGPAGRRGKCQAAAPASPGQPLPERSWRRWPRWRQRLVPSWRGAAAVGWWQRLVLVLRPDCTRTVGQWARLQTWGKAVPQERPSGAGMGRLRSPQCLQASTANGSRGCEPSSAGRSSLRISLDCRLSSLGCRSNAQRSRTCHRRPDSPARRLIDAEPVASSATAAAERPAV